MLRRIADKLLINGDYADVLLSDDSAAPVGTKTVDIKGYGIIGDGPTLISANKTCSAAAVEAEAEITVIIPESCECPYEWCLTVVCLPNLQLYETYNTFPSSKVDCYEDPAGGTPTDTDTAAAIAAAINADPFACVTATVVGAVITLTSKEESNGFQVYSPSATIPPFAAKVPTVLGTNDMARIFPIETGTFGSIPDLPIRGANYCKWNVVIRGREDVQDVDGANHWNAYEKEVDIYIHDDGSVAYQNLRDAIDLTLGT